MPETELYQNETVADLYDLEVTGQQDVPLYLRLARQQDGMVLDVACGTGRVLLPLARAGVIVTGLDASEPMLLRAENKLGHEPVSVQSNVTLVPADIREFRLPHHYAMAFLAANSFCMLTSVAEQEAVLRNIYKHLDRNGIVIVDLFDPDPVRLEPGWTDRLEFDDPARGRHFRRTDRATATDRVLQIKTVKRSYEVANEAGDMGIFLECDYRIRYTWPYELQHLIRLCGFRLEAVLGQYDGAPFATPGGKLVAVGRKI